MAIGHVAAAVRLLCTIQLTARRRPVVLTLQAKVVAAAKAANAHEFIMDFADGCVRTPIPATTTHTQARRGDLSHALVVDRQPDCYPSRLPPPHSYDTKVGEKGVQLSGGQVSLVTATSARPAPNSHCLFC